MRDAVMKPSMAKQLRKLFIANLKMMFREKAVWFWNIFFPIILMVLFMIIFGGGGSGGEFKATVAVVSEGTGEASTMMLEQLRHIPVLEWKEEQPTTPAQAIEWVEGNKVDAAIILPQGEEPIRLVVNTEKAQNAVSQALSGIVQQFAQQASWTVAGLAPAYTMEVEMVTAGGQDLSPADFLLTGMIALSLAQGGLFGMVELVEMRRNGVLKRLRMTPVRMGLFGMSSMAVRFILGIVQIILLTLIGVFGFGAKLHIDVPALCIAFFVGSLAFNALGYLISSFSKSMEAYMGVANIASFLMMFMSGIFFPINNLPGWLQSVSGGIPLTYFVNALRDGMVYGTNILHADFWFNVVIVAGWGALAFILGAVLYRRANLTAR